MLFRSRIRELTSLLLKHEGFDKLTGKLPISNASTLLELFKSKAANSSDTKAFSVLNHNNELEYMNFKEANFCAKKLGSYLSTITEPREVVGIASVNRPEWVLAEYATYYANCVNTPLHVTFDGNSLSYILFLTKMKTLVISSSLAESIISKMRTGLLKDQIGRAHV